MKFRVWRLHTNDFTDVAFQVCTNVTIFFIDENRLIQLIKKLNLLASKYGPNRQNLKDVPQNFTEVFNFIDVTANGVIRRNQHHKEKKTWAQ